MTDNRRWAESYLRSAEFDIEDGVSDLKRKRFARAVARAGSAVEYSLKAALFSAGAIDVPEEHRIWEYARRRRHFFPKDYQEWVDRRASANEEMADSVVKAKYGSRVNDRLPEEIFSHREEAEAAVATAKEVQGQVSELLRRHASRRSSP